MRVSERKTPSIGRCRENGWRRARDSSRAYNDPLNQTFKCCKKSTLLTLLLTLLILAPQNTASAETSIGTILYSQHYNTDTVDPNESHKGLYIKFNRWTLGSFENSYRRNSNFVAYEAWASGPFAINLGLANGYEPDSHARRGYLPLLAAVYKKKYLRVSLTPDAVVFGLEFGAN